MNEVNPNSKAQMSNQIQNSKSQIEVLSFVIDLAFGFDI
jgi:hypothetical protein